MAFAQKLTMRQGQSLVMTPQLSQSIKLLTLSNIELAAFVEAEIEKNPVLEAAPNQPLSDRTGQADQPVVDAVRDLTNDTELETSAKALSENLGTSLENVYPDEQDYRAPASDNAKTKEEYDSRISTGGLQLSSAVSAHDQTVADYTAAQETLQDTLTGQLAISGAPITISKIASDIIDNLDPAGYLRTDLPDIAERLGAIENECEIALKLVQSFEPTGVGARSLEECLRLQLKDQDRLDPAIDAVLDNLDLLAKRDFAALQSLSGLDMEDLGDILLEIQSLDPKPGTIFESTPVQHIVPDVFVSENPDGSWHIELNTETLPRVLVNNEYMADIGGKLSSENEKEFISDCLQTANWLTKSLDQRAQTILKVSREIVKQQDAFLAYGVRHLRPLTLQMVADEIEMHESSVSRVTSNKYMLTPRGLFELKYFFTTGINHSGNGENHSSESVRDRIKAMINAETSKTVLSDEAIVDKLNDDGIEIARRTVAKYREAMQIPSSVQRRREKKALEAASGSQIGEQSVELTH
ncbi:MAG: RNA polymerase factor sigma-54 [Rhizobiaceae bacterium]